MTSLPVYKTLSGGSGQYVHAEIETPIGRLHIDGNSKISGFEDPQPNAFSLPAIDTCPGSTPTCRAACYATRIPEPLRSWYRENLETLERSFREYSNPFDCPAAQALGNWIQEHAPRDPGFRWHVSGDVMHAQHARWVVAVSCTAVGVRQWIYTRTHSAIPLLRAAPMLRVNASIDRDLIGSRTHGARRCYMVDASGYVPADLPPGSVIFPDKPLRSDPTWFRSLPLAQRKMVCPADAFGQSRARSCGPCRKCL